MAYETRKLMKTGEVWIKGERLRVQFVAALEVGLRVGAKAEYDGLSELDRQKAQSKDVLGIDRERPFAETVTRFRFLAEIIRLLCGRLALKRQILGVGICRRRSFETSGLDLGELILTSPSQDG